MRDREAAIRKNDQYFSPDQFKIVGRSDSDLLAVQVGIRRDQPLVVVVGDLSEASIDGDLLTFGQLTKFNPEGWEFEDW